jgi:cell wall-associated NlpC family hydrolase
MQINHWRKLFVLYGLIDPHEAGVSLPGRAIRYTHPEENMGLLLLSLPALAAFAAGQPPRRAVVLEPVLNMHSQPSADSEVVSQTQYAMTVGIDEQQGEWTHIKAPDGYPGWVESKALRVLGDDEVYAEKGRIVTVESLVAHLYRENSVTRHKPLLSVPFETPLEVLEEPADEESRWIVARLPDGRKAWVQRGDVAFEPAARTVPQLIELARRFLGRPYTWGGTTSFGYDCSGFTQMLCRRGGRAIPRDSKVQAAWDGMAAVRKPDLQPGDLLYFGPSLEKVNHTGFYIGDGEFIHATTNTHPVIQISRLDEERWTRLLVACRRWKQQ